MTYAHLLTVAIRPSARFLPARSLEIFLPTSVESPVQNLENFQAIYVFAISASPITSQRCVDLHAVTRH
jgi:hypothetical protein